MKIAAVTCYTGGADLRDMTDDMVNGLWDSRPSGSLTSLKVVIVGQGTKHLAKTARCGTMLWTEEENKGFGFGMNLGIELSAAGTPDYILVLNNDLQFPRKNWLEELLKEASPDRICSPATDKAAIYMQKGPVNRDPIMVQEISAYCWLVPFAWCQWLKKHKGFWLFDEEFGSYGEDNYTAFLLSKVYGKKVFRYVRRSWVKHLRGRTAALVRPNRKRSSKLLIDRFQQQLTYPRLRPDLQQWAKRYISILSGRVR